MKKEFNSSMTIEEIYILEHGESFLNESNDFELPDDTEENRIFYSQLFQAREDIKNGKGTQQIIEKA